MNNIESVVLNLLLAGPHPDLDILRVQFATAEVKNREYTGVGFFSYFKIAEAAPKLRTKSVIIRDVYAEIDDLEHGAGFLLFVNMGVIDMLECFIFEDKWPENSNIQRAFYMRPKKAGDTMLIETTERDLCFALKFKTA